MLRQRRSDILVSVSAALFYAIVSITLTLLNKAIFATYNFSDTRVLGLGQISTALIMLKATSAMGLLKLPPLNIQTIYKIWPLAASYLLMVVCGFAAMRGTNIVMFGVLRRTGIVLVIVLEFTLLGKKSSAAIIASTAVMVVGVIVAGYADLSFDPTGYFFAFITNIATACYIVLIPYYKASLKLDAFGMLFYNALLSVPFLLVVSVVCGDFERMMDFEFIDDMGFWILFIMSCSLGFVINWSVFLNTSVNSALTQTVTGQLKDIIVLLIGVTIFGDVKFSLLNTAGVAISLCASVSYATIKYFEMNSIKYAALPTVIPETPMHDRNS